MTTSDGNGLLTVDKVGPGDEESEQDRNGVQRHTHQAELETLLAVSTVPPKTTSFMPSTTDEPPAPPTRGCTSDLRTSMTEGRPRL